MQIADSVVFITGANRGIGLAFAREALARGARKVYAAARDPSRVLLPGVVPIQLDVTDQQQVDRVVRECGDVTILVNNAGIALTGGFLADGSMESARKQLALLKEAVPRMTRIGVIASPTAMVQHNRAGELAAGARALGLTLALAEVGNAGIPGAALRERDLQGLLRDGLATRAGDHGERAQRRDEPCPRHRRFSPVLPGRVCSQRRRL